MRKERGICRPPFRRRRGDVYVKAGVVYNDSKITLETGDMGKEEAKQKIAELVTKYEALSPTEVKSFHEAKTKQGFIEPLFRALGWNFEDTNEVAPEEKASNGRVDYAFKLNGVSQFYLEAKPLKADLTNEDYIKQAVTYAYNKGVTWAILSNFEQLRFFSAQGKPFLTFTYNDYATDFEKLWLLSRESIKDGALNKEAAKYGALPQPIEIRLFSKLRQWRELLFNQIHGHQKKLSLTKADDIAKKILDRLIFIRTCEDRELEDRKLLAAVHQWKSGKQKGELVEELRRIFLYYQEIYDSELFDPDQADSVFIDRTTIEDILTGTYEIPGSLASYNFKDIGADALGRVYEQYLGYATQKAKQRVEAQLKLGIFDEDTFEITSKKKRRKEQGIYYTPQFVTDYIVRETVGLYIKEHNYNEIRTMKILDPACGSGSFLIRAFDELLNYHANQRGIFLDDLKQEERLTVLLSNIYGVDLDMQAVDVTRLNLLLRTLTKKGKLPYLSANIRPGNSLISGTEEELKKYFGNDWKDKKVFNWEQQYKDIIDNGGFDVVIGNPPYVRIQSLPRDEADYYRDRYNSAYGSFDIYVLFIEQAINLLKQGGRLGLITSGKFLKAEYGKKLRQVLRDNCIIESIIDLSTQQVFGEATTYPAIIILKKGNEDSPLHYTFIPADSDLTSNPLGKFKATITNQAAITKGMWPPPAIGDTLLNKLTRKTKPLSEYAERIFQGLITSADKVYILEKRGEADGDRTRVYSRSMDRIFDLETAKLKPLISGKDIERYASPLPKQLLLFPYNVSGDTAELIPPGEFKRLYPKCWNYLVENRETLEDRENGKMKHEKWYSYVYPKNLALHDRPKLAIPRLVHRLKAILDNDGRFYLDNVDVGGLTLKDTSQNLYILGLLNSTLINYYFGRISVAFRGGFLSANRQFLEPLPIHILDHKNKAEKKIYNILISDVEKMLDINKKLAPIRDDPFSERDEVKREIERTEKEIDNLVYDLYGLTEEERKIVEGS